MTRHRLPFGGRLTSALAALACVGLVGFQGLFLYSSSGRDDSHITYWSAKSLAERGEIVNYNGAAVEQSSSLLHVVVLAALYRISGWRLATLGGLVAVLAGGLTAWTAWRFARDLELRWAPVAGLACAVSPPLVYWALGGLETTLAAWTALLVVRTTARLLAGGCSAYRAIAAGASMLAYVAARPEGIFVVLLFLGVLAAFLRTGAPGRRPWTALASASAAAAAGFAALTLYRLTVFGKVFPQPVYAKAAGLEPRQIVFGGLYLVEHFWIPSLVASVLLAAMALRGTQARRAGASAALVAAAGFVAGEVAFAVASGGDWMEGGRFLVPAVGPLAVLAAAGLERLPGRRLAAAAAAGLVAFSAVDSLKLMMEDSTGVPLIKAAPVYRPVLARLGLPAAELSFFEYANRIHLRDLPAARELERAVERILGQRPGPVRVMSSQMGLVAFRLASRHFREVELIDMYGLVTTHFTDCAVTRDLPRKRLGLTLSYADYFARLERIESECGLRRPDVIYSPIDPGSGLPALLAANGYIVFYRQTGAVGTGGFGGTAVPADQVLAARAELAELLDGGEPRVFAWP